MTKTYQHAHEIPTGTPHAESTVLLKGLTPRHEVITLTHRMAGARLGVGCWHVTDVEHWVVSVQGNSASTGLTWLTESDARTCYAVWSLPDGPERDALAKTIKW